MCVPHGHHERRHPQSHHTPHTHTQWTRSSMTNNLHSTSSDDTHTYPIPQPLTNVLRTSYSTPELCELNSISNGIEELIGNAFHALDGMYFTTPGVVRSQCPGFVSRMVVRVELVELEGTVWLGITDLGVGMTRADLINVFGVGSVQPQSQKMGKKKKQTKVNCTSANLGGFYAAFCAMAKSCVISTKSKFDDYYEFRIGGPEFETFTISKPISKEGQLPMPDVGYDQFSDVRGESGTRVMFELNDEAREVLQDEADLRKMMEHIFETSQYNVIFSQDEEAENVVAKDVEMVQQLAKSLINDPSSMEDYALEDQQVDDAIPVIVLERSKYIPIRLSMAERKMLRLIDASMHCCDYTNVIDVPFKSKMKRMHSMFKGITAILTGTVLACDYEAGQKLSNEKGATFSDFENFYQQLFEITRRHKIMNPEKMRTEYGKFIYFLQDAIAHADELELRVVRPVETVYKFLEERHGLELLKDPLIVIATSEVLATKGKSRTQIDTEIRKKERAVSQLKQKYKSTSLSTDDIHMCLYSICDNDSFLNSNRVPIDEIIGYLKTFFKPNEIEEGFSLSIVSGENGSRLSHSHERQYYFALQSLTLWRDIIHEMFYLWHMAEEDLLSEAVGYELKDTGQGKYQYPCCLRMINFERIAHCCVLLDLQCKRYAKNTKCT